MTAKPLLKWVGGKTQIMDALLSRFPATIQDYHEPFLGGGSVLLATLQRGGLSGTVYASDLNPHLIALYKQVQEAPRPLIAVLRVLERNYQRASLRAPQEVNREPQNPTEAQTSAESYYYWIRGEYNRLHGLGHQSHVTTAMTIFLNRTCFRGLYREGPRGFNVPFGHYKNPAICDEANILAVSALIQGVVFRCQSFEASLAVVTEHDFVYLDPPYVPESATSFVGYTADGFPGSSHAALFTAIKELPCPFLLSNANVALVREAFPLTEFQVDVVSARRAIHSKEPGSKTEEVLIRPSI
jgi:DNA adenine methylase